jgi:hypothetical protein
MHGPDNDFPGDPLPAADCGMNMDPARRAPSLAPTFRRGTTADPVPGQLADPYRDQDDQPGPDAPPEAGMPFAVQLEGKPAAAVGRNDTVWIYRNGDGVGASVTEWLEMAAAAAGQKMDKKLSETARAEITAAEAEREHRYERTAMVRELLHAGVPVDQVLTWAGRLVEWVATADAPGWQPGMTTDALDVDATWVSRLAQSAGCSPQVASLVLGAHLQMIKEMGL